MQGEMVKQQMRGHLDSEMSSRSGFGRNQVLTSLSSIEVYDAVAPKSGTFFAENKRPLQNSKVNYLE